MLSEPRIAVLVPCYNEATTIRSVVTRFAAALPQAKIYVYDNNSTDGTAEVARQSGGIVRHEPRQGKGNVIRRMFADTEADIYILVDGDDTYDAGAAPKLVEQLRRNRLDFVNAARRAENAAAFRRGHRAGNRLLSAIVELIFGRQFSDMLSGYKIFSRRFVKSFPAVSRGFEIETELAIHALQLRMPSAEVEASYVDRPEGSHSKLRSYRDGTRILLLIARLVKDEKPLMFFGLMGIAFVLAGIALGVPIVIEYFHTGLVPRIPTAILSCGVITIGVLSILAGLILDVITLARHELKRLAYLAVPAFDDPS